MSLKVAVLGIDGSGKSSLAQALPVVLAAELEIVAGSAGDDYWVFGPDQDHLAPRFHPRGFPIAAHLSRLARRWAKRSTGNPRLYPYLKLAQMLFQDDAAVAIGRRYRAAAMVADGNLILSATGRAGNYRNRKERATPADIEAAYRHLLSGTPLDADAASRLPALGAAATVARWLRRIGFDGVWLPDAVIFLDLPPETALERVGRRGRHVDAHENLADMTHARESYVKAVAAYTAITGRPACVIDAQDKTPGEILRVAFDYLQPQLEKPAEAARQKVLGTSPEAGLQTALKPGYLFRYLLPRLFSGAWRELTFPLSKTGRMLLQEGYSAGVMRVIHEHDQAAQGALDRVFFGYPLHRAVYDRLQILTARLQPELEARLQKRGRVRIFTAPSGFAYDLFRPLEEILQADPAAARRIDLVAADLDPHGVLAPELTARAQKLGIKFRIILGDLTAEATRREVAAGGPYQVALFVGLSSWLPKPQTVAHLSWLRGQLAPGAVLVTDCFSADTYAEGGRHAGYRAGYYSPVAYQALLEWCGYAGLEAAPESGRDRINHVFVTRARVAARAPAARA
ncbi:MAG TPA: hypothetical protein VF160_14235 [Candidatus Dormibacteraeota bacterium]